MSENSDENSMAESSSVSMDQSTASLATSTAAAPSIASSSPANSLQSLSLGSETTKQEKFKVTLDSSTNTYFSGQTIRGTISVYCKQKKKIRGKCETQRKRHIKFK